MTVALITGITGQDGSYLAEHLLDQGVEVVGLVRRRSDAGLGWAAHLALRVTLIEGDLLDQGSLVRAMQEHRPDWVFNLAAQSFVGRSWREPVHTADVTGLGAVRVLEAARLICPDARVYQASSSEMYGAATGAVTVNGPFHPRSPYGAAKLFAHSMAVNYRESYGMFVSCGVLFNHESPRRGPEFVTRKVAAGAARAAAGDTTPLALGDLDARRDWGWAPDYVVAMQQMLAGDAPVDVLIGTGESHSVRELCEHAYRAVGLDWRAHVRVDSKLMRPAEVPALCADPRDALQKLGWRPTVSFGELVARMVRAERARLNGERVA